MSKETRLEAVAREKVVGWRKLLRRHSPQARQILSKALRERLTFRPEEHNGKRGYRFTAEGSIMPLLSGMVPELEMRAVASPTGKKQRVRARGRAVAASGVALVPDRDSRKVAHATFQTSN